MFEEDGWEKLGQYWETKLGEGYLCFCVGGEGVTTAKEINPYSNVERQLKSQLDNLGPKCGQVSNPAS